MSWKIFCLCGPTACGKTTLAEYLVTESPWSYRCLTKAITSTTRLPREGEVDGVHYHFLSKEDFEKGIELGAFFEYVQIHGNYYGTPWSSFNTEMSVIVILNIAGAIELKNHFGESAVLIFITTPAIEDCMKRLRARGTTGEEYYKRIEVAEEEMSEYLYKYEMFDHLIVNDSLRIAQLEMDSIVSHELPRLVTNSLIKGWGLDDF